MTTHQQKSPRILRERELCDRLGVSRTPLWRWNKDGTNGFPKSVKLTSRTKGWFEHEVEAFEANRSRTAA